MPDDILLYSVVDPHATLHGYSQSELGDRWWQEMAGTPVRNHPAIYDDSSDPNGRSGSSARASETRIGRIQLLAGWFGYAPTYETPDTVNRTITIPAGSSLFFPMLNTAWWDGPLANGRPEAGINERGGPTEEELREFFDWWASIATPVASIDGVRIPDTTSHFQQSEDIFFSRYARDNILGVTVPHTSAQIAAGYWIGLMPLSPETHTITFGGLVDYPDTENDFQLNVTYTISYDLNEIVGNRYDNRRSVRGTNGWDEIRGLGGNDYIVGRGGNDVLYGGSGSDTLIGTTPYGCRPGCGEIDILYGGGGRDTFVLGDRHSTFYRGRGMTDYAIIKDFSGDDTIRLHGSRCQYQLREDYALGGSSGTAIFRGRCELIGFIEDATNLSLRSNDFSFAGC